MHRHSILLRLAETPSNLGADVPTGRFPNFQHRLLYEVYIRMIVFIPCNPRSFDVPFEINAFVKSQTIGSNQQFWHW